MLEPVAAQKTPIREKAESAVKKPVFINENVTSGKTLARRMISQVLKSSTCSYQDSPRIPMDSRVVPVRIKILHGTDA